jgi:hypothetical protein
MLKLGRPHTHCLHLRNDYRIGNLMGTLGDVSRDGQGWRSGDMRRRWLGLGLPRAAERWEMARHEAAVPSTERARLPSRDRALGIRPSEVL